jgi:hypothetical protein
MSARCAAAGAREEAFTAQLELAAPELAGRLRVAERTSSVTGMLRGPNVIRQAWARVRPGPHPPAEHGRWTLSDVDGAESGTYAREAAWPS